ncbi:YjbE family putative metal transport protein [Rhizobium binxianense]
MPAFLDQHTISAYFEVIMINLLLSGDNVIVIGMAAAGLVSELRGKAIAVGIAAAAVIRIVFAVAAAKLLAITGITLAGGLMLLWICWTMGRELISSEEEEEVHAGVAEGDGGVHIKPKLFRQAIAQIIFADVSMSLDNVLAVAGAAKENMNALIFGLILSVLLMGVASNFVAKLLSRFKWIGWIGLAIIVYVALDMIWNGSEQLLVLYAAHA